MRGVARRLWAMRRRLSRGGVLLRGLVASYGHAPSPRLRRDALEGASRASAYQWMRCVD